MTAFTVWKFETPEGAAHAEMLLEGAERDRLVTIVDHAVVSWPLDDKEPTLEHGHEDRWRGAGLGASAKATEKMGITEEQLRTIGSEITPGSSLLFVVTQDGDLDRLAERMRGVEMKLLSTTLFGAEQAALDESMGG